MSTQTIDVEATPEPETKQTMAVARVQSGAVGPALTVEQIHERLEFVRKVMREEMKEGVDYGKVPGTGDKPSLLQPGAQKLLMTFNLRAVVRKEVKSDIHMPIFGNREYEFTIRVFPNGCDPEREGTDGVGTCSTLESKYRYRKATRKCPECGKEAIIAGKEEFGGGFICWKKKDGCGAKFHAEHPAIISQSVEDVENEDPADQWNTVRKMAFKRGLVAAVINFTNTSELWTQDVEDMADNQGRQKWKPSTSTGVKPPGSPATRPAQPAIFADAATRDRLLAQLTECRDLAKEYFEKVGALLPTERLEDLPLRFVPVTKKQFERFQAAMADFGNGGEAMLGFPPNPDREPAKGKPAESSQKPSGKLAESSPPDEKPPQADPQSPKASAVRQNAKKDPEWFFDIVCPIPNKGQRRDDYLKEPDTIGGLYDRMKNGDQSAQKRLWGFAKHWNPEPRTVGNRTYPVSPEEFAFREALDEFCEWHDKHGSDSQAASEPVKSNPAGGVEEEDDLPF